VAGERRHADRHPLEIVDAGDPLLGYEIMVACRPVAGEMAQIPHPGGLV
jgi:hypothetical protein